MKDPFDPGLATAPLRRHHERVSHMMERVLELIAEIEPGVGPADQELMRAMTFLERSVRPHAEAEDCFLYPEVSRLAGNQQLAALMSVDHAFVSQYLRDLRSEITAVTGSGEGGVTEHRLRRLNQAAGRLSGLMRAHFESEELVYFPLIDQNMKPEDIRQRIVDPINAMSQADLGPYAADMRPGRNPLESGRSSG